MLPGYKQIANSSPKAASIYSTTFLKVLDGSVARLPITRSPDGKPVVLFVKMDGIGDFVIWSTLFKSIEAAFPREHYQRVLIGDERWKELVTPEAPFDTNIFVSNRSFVLNPIYRAWMLTKIRKLGAKTAINFRLTRRFLWEDAVVRVSGADERIASVGIDNLMTEAQERLSARWYTRLVPGPESRTHETEALEALLGAASGVAGLSAPAVPKPYRENGYAVFVLGAGDPSKRWPADAAAETIEALTQEYPKVVLCGSAADREFAEVVKAGLRREVTDLVGETSLDDLKSIVSSADLVVSNDTGAAHISGLAGVPTVVITPGNHVGRFFPYPEHVQRKLGMRQVSVVADVPCLNCGWYCTNPDAQAGAAKPCIGRVSAAEVLRAVHEVRTIIAGHSGS